MKKIRYYLLITALFGSLNLSAQDKKLTNVIIGNEGNFNSSNATITNYELENSTATDGIFLTANGIGIGDVVQSLSWIDDKIYVVVNNSQKIVVLNPNDFTQTGQITFGAGASPREIIQVSENKAYVTDLYASAVYSVNLDDFSVTEDTVKTGINPDRIIAHNGFAYVANSGFGADSTIFKIDIATDAVVDTFNVYRGPAGMIVDSENTLWVVSTGYSGDYDESWNLIPGTSHPGGLNGIDLHTGEVIVSTELASADADIALDEEQGKVYVNSGGVRAFDIENHQFASDTLVSGSFYAMGYDSENNTFFLSDAKDFSSAGEIYVYNNTGEQTGSFNAGIIPSSFLFVYTDMTNTPSETQEKVRKFALSQNYPNPFNPTTKIEFSIEQSGHVKLEVFSTTGQKVAELINGLTTAGSHSVGFDASLLSSGIYIYRIVTQHGILSRKMILVK